MKKNILLVRKPKGTITLKSKAINVPGKDSDRLIVGKKQKNKYA